MNAHAIALALSDNPRGRARREATAWWKKHRFTLAELADDEIQALASSAVRGNRAGVEVMMMANAPRSVWVAYRNAVTRRIAALAHRRARAAFALRKLSLIALRMLGSAITRGL